MEEAKSGVNLSADDVAKIIKASGEAMAKGVGAGPQPQWCGIGCGGHLASVETKARPQTTKTTKR